LSRRGFLAALTLKNSEGVDIFARRPHSGRAVSIQVKASQSNKAAWVLSDKSEGLKAPDFFYVFVRLGSVKERPVFHVVPSTVVAEQIARHHKEWLSGTKKDGSIRKDTPMRVFRDDEGVYLERWEMLD